MCDNATALWLLFIIVPLLTWCAGYQQAKQEYSR
jgi:hypothetical protein